MPTSSLEGSEGVLDASTFEHTFVLQVVLFQDPNASGNNNPQPNEWAMSKSADLQKSGLWRSSRLAALHLNETITAHSTLPIKQTPHKVACLALFSLFCSNDMGTIALAHTHQMITASAKAALTFFNVEFKLVVKSDSDASCFEQFPVPNNDPSLFLSFIGVIILEGAHFAPTTYQAFELIVASIHQQVTIFYGRSSKFIVESFSKERKNKAKLLVSQGVQHKDFLPSNNNTEHHRKPQQDLVAAWLPNAILNASLNELIKLNDLIGLNDFNNLFSLSFNQDPLIAATARNPFCADSFKLIAELFLREHNLLQPLSES